MARYSVEVSATAEKQLTKLGKTDRVRVGRAIVALAKDPRPAGCRKLQGYSDVYRIRVGRFRIIYSVDGRRVVITVLKIGHRREVYRT